MADYKGNHCILCPKAFCCPTCRNKHEKIVHKIDLGGFHTCYNEHHYNKLNPVIASNNRTFLSTPEVLTNPRKNMNAEKPDVNQESRISTPFHPRDKNKREDNSFTPIENCKQENTEYEDNKKRFKKIAKNVTFCTSTPNVDSTRRSDEKAEKHLDCVPETLVETCCLSTSEGTQEIELSSNDDELFKTAQFQLTENCSVIIAENTEPIEISLSSTSSIPQAVWQTITCSIKSALETTKNYCKFGDISTKRVLEIADDDDQNPSPKRRKYESIKCRPPIHELPILRLKFHKWTQTEERYFQ